MDVNTQSQFGFSEYMTTQQNTERFFLDETTICIQTTHPSIGLQACVCYQELTEKAA